MPWTTATIHNIFLEVFTTTAPTPAFPSIIYLGLGKSTQPQLDGLSFAEITNPGNWSQYARQIITLAAPANRAVASNNVQTFHTSASGVTGGPISIEYGGIFNALTAGNILAYGRLAVPLSLINGALVQFPAGQITITDDFITV